jgi:hypothetical protein
MRVALDGCHRPSPLKVAIETHSAVSTHWRIDRGGAPPVRRTAPRPARQILQIQVRQSHRWVILLSEGPL